MVDQAYDLLREWIKWTARALGWVALVPGWERQGLRREVGNVKAASTDQVGWSCACAGGVHGRELPAGRPQQARMKLRHGVEAFSS